MPKSTDLDWLLDPTAKAPQVSSSGKEKAKASGPTSEDLSALVEQLSGVWEPQARIIILFETKCSHCGEVSLIPEVHLNSLPKRILIRFRNKRTGALWEKLCLPENVPPRLPHVIRRIPATTSLCASCAQAAELRSGLVELFDEFIQLTLKDLFFKE